MNKQNDFERILKGALVGGLAGIVGSWAANQFHFLWSVLRGEERVPQVAELSQRGGRPDSAAAKEAAVAGEAAPEDATVTIASAVLAPLSDRPLEREEKHKAGVAVHYAFGAGSGALYGIAAELVPSVTAMGGIAFGIAVWAIAVEMTLPALGLTEPPRRYPFRMHAYSVISHSIYGASTEAVRRRLQSIGKLAALHRTHGFSATAI